MTEEFLEVVKAEDLAKVRGLLKQNPVLKDAHTASRTRAAVLALHYGHLKVSKAILARRPNLEVHTASAVGGLARVKEIVRADPREADVVAIDGYTPLGLAAYLGHRPIVSYRVTQGADVNYVGLEPNRFTALTGSVSQGHGAVADILRSRGAKE